VSKRSEIALVRSTRILHNNEEYLLQDENASTASRMITFLTRPESTEGGEQRGLQRVKTNLGDWIPIAKWERGVLEPIRKDYSEVSSTLHTILEKYLNHHRSKGKKRRKMYYYIEKEGLPLYQLAASHPYGLALCIYTKKKLAQEILPESAGEMEGVKIRQTADLRDFLIRAADEGYAGAILDDREPVYFCLDPADSMVILRLTMNEDEEVQEFVLNENGTWRIYEGEEEIEFFLDQDRCDRNMVKNLGEIPFLGHTDIDKLWTVEQTGQGGIPFVLSPDESPFQGIPDANVILLFHQRQNAMEFLLQRGLINCEAVRVDKLRDFLENAGRNNQTVILEPFSHRATGGVLWMNDGDVVLDSFSGFWILGEGWDFSPAM
jgi:hypothetical protein